MRLTLFVRLTAAFAGVTAFSLLLALAIVYGSFSTDLDRAAHERLERAALVASEFLADHLRTVQAKYAGLSHEPRFRAAVEEAGDAPTLRGFAADLVAERGSARILFLDRRDAPIAAAGDAALDPLAGASASAPVDLVFQEARPFVVARVPLMTTRPVGCLVAIERLDPRTVAWWSTACGADVVFARQGEGPRAGAETLVKPVRGFGGMEMRAELPVKTEHEALARARRRILASAAAALFAAIGASLVVSRGISRPILALKEAAHRIGSGDFTARAGVSRADEIGDVARAVDDMAGHLGESRSRLQALIDGLPFAALLLERDGERSIQYVNRAFERITGHPRTEAIGRAPQLFVRGKEAFTAAMWDAVARGEAWTARFAEHRKDGAPYEQEATISAVRDDSGALLNFVVVLRDVTQEVALEAELRQSQKMDALGRLAGGVAHDFNNLLTVITGYGEILLDGFAADDPRRAELEEMRGAGVRAAALTRQLLAFSRKQIVQPKVLDLNTSIVHMDKMLRRVIGEDIRLVVSPDPGLGPVRADPGQMEQVLMNLVVNARDAMPRGGTLTIETANVDIDEKARSEPRARVRPGRYAMLAVRDTGCGMNEETKLHLFEPFFTTKAPGRGTGLGLSTVYGIVEHAGGGIAVESEPGRGSVFRIYFPRIEASSAEPGPESRSAAPLPRGTETILVVEDDPAVRELAARILRANGYEVLPACHGAEAILVCERHEGPIHLLLTDVVMPHMSGGEVAERLATLRPSMRIAFMSGYSDSQRLQGGMLNPDTVFIQKPFAPGDLLRKVREALEARAPAPKG